MTVMNGDWKTAQIQMKNRLQKARDEFATLQRNLHAKDAEIAALRDALDIVERCMPKEG